MKALCLIDGFRDSDYVQIVNELVPELEVLRARPACRARVSRACRT